MNSSWDMTLHNEIEKVGVELGEIYLVSIIYPLLVARRESSFHTRGTQEGSIANKSSKPANETLTSSPRIRVSDRNTKTRLDGGATRLSRATVP